MCIKLCPARKHIVSYERFTRVHNHHTMHVCVVRKIKCKYIYVYRSCGDRIRLTNTLHTRSRYTIELIRRLLVCFDRSYVYYVPLITYYNILRRTVLARLLPKTCNKIILTAETVASVKHFLMTNKSYSVHNKHLGYAYNTCFS